MDDCATEKAMAPGTTQRKSELGMAAMVMCVGGWRVAVLRRVDGVGVRELESEQLS